MNTQEQIDKIISDYLPLLPIEDGNLLQHSEVKASKFLLAITKLASIRDQLLNEKVKKESLLAVSFNQALSNAKAGDAKARETLAKANPEYLATNEEVDTIENKLLYIRTMLEVFNNAHLLYRSLLKNEQG